MALQPANDSENETKEEANKSKLSYTVVNRTVVTHENDDDAAEDLTRRLEQLAMGNPQLLQELGDEWDDFQSLSQTANSKNSNLKPKSNEKKKNFLISDYKPNQLSAKMSTISESDEKKSENNGMKIDLSQIKMDNNDNNKNENDNKKNDSLKIEYKLIKINEFANCTFGVQLIIFPKNQISIWIGIVNASNNSNKNKNDNNNNDNSNESKEEMRSKTDESLEMIPNLNNMFLSLCHRKTMYNDIGQRNVSTIALLYSSNHDGIKNNQSNLNENNNETNDDFAKKMSSSLVKYANRKFKQMLTIEVSCDIPNQVLNTRVMKDDTMLNPSFGSLGNDFDDMDYQMMNQFSTISFEIEQALIEILNGIYLRKDNQSECKDNQDDQDNNEDDTMLIVD